MSNLPIVIPVGDTGLPATEFADILTSAAGYALAEKSEATRRAYASDFADFTAWCARFDLEPVPAEVATVAAYLAALADAGLKVSTINRRCAAIAYVHRQRRFEPPTGAEPVKAVLRGIHRTTGSFMATFPGYWADFRARIPVLGPALAAAAMLVALATDQVSTLAKDGTDATAATQLTGGAGQRGWLSGIFVQALALATGLGTQVDTAAASSTASASIFGWLKRFSANDDTALQAITAATTREGSLSTSAPDAFANSGAGKLGALEFVWKYTKAAAASLLSLVGLLSAKSATGALGAANATVSVSGGPYGAVGFKLVGTSVQTLSAFGTRDGNAFDVPLGIITEVAGGGSTSGQSLAISGAGPSSAMSRRLAASASHSSPRPIPRARSPRP